MKKRNLLIIICAVAIILFLLWLYFLSPVVFFTSQCEFMCASCAKSPVFFNRVYMDCMRKPDSICNTNQRCAVENFKCKYEYNVNEECKSCFDSCKNSSDSECDFNCIKVYSKRGE